MGRRRFVWIAVGFAVLCAACSTAGDDVNQPFGPVSIAAGALADGTVTIDRTEIRYVTITPVGFESGDTAPVLFAFPPGGQDLDLTQRFATQTYQAEAVRRGWVVVSPAAPNQRLFFDGSEVLVGGLLDWTETWVTAEGGKPHLVGISNGGLSAFRALSLNPSRFESVLVFPGYPASETDRSAAEGLDIPVRMFVGELDTGWVEPMEETFALLQRQGMDVTLEIMPGEGHVIGALSDGVRIFDELDAQR